MRESKQDGPYVMRWSDTLAAFVVEGPGVDSCGFDRTMKAQAISTRDMLNQAYAQGCKAQHEGRGA